MEEIKQGDEVFYTNTRLPHTVESIHEIMYENNSVTIYVLSGGFGTTVHDIFLLRAEKNNKK